MKKKTRYTILLVWLLIILIDIICAFTISRPVFMLPVARGEITQYYGMGYTMEHRCAMTPDGYRDGGFSVNPVLYLVINGIVFGKLAMDQKRT